MGLGRRAAMSAVATAVLILAGCFGADAGGGGAADALVVRGGSLFDGTGDGVVANPGIVVVDDRFQAIGEDAANQALAAGDLSSLFATVDFTKLKARVDDDLVDEPGGVPSRGPMNRILVSHFEPTQGRGNSAGGDVTGGFRCDPPECTPQFSGRLQPYSVYLPDAAPPLGGYGLVVNLHGAGSNHNHFEGGPPDPPLQTWQMLAESGRPSIMAMPNARGTTYFYHGLAATDVFEMWAHVAANYDLDPGRVVQTGSSMGGFGTYKFGSQFPDLYTAIFPNVGINTAAASVPPVASLAGKGGDA